MLKAFDDLIISLVYLNLVGCVENYMKNEGFRSFGLIVFIVLIHTKYFINPYMIIFNRYQRPVDNTEGDVFGSLPPCTIF